MKLGHVASGFAIIAVLCCGPAAGRLLDGQSTDPSPDTTMATDIIADTMAEETSLVTAVEAFVDRLEMDVKEYTKRIQAAIRYNAITDHMTGGAGSATLQPPPPYQGTVEDTPLESSGNGRVSSSAGVGSRGASARGHGDQEGSEDSQWTQDEETKEWSEGSDSDSSGSSDQKPHDEGTADSDSTNFAGDRDQDSEEQWVEDSDSSGSSAQESHAWTDHTASNQSKPEAGTDLFEDWEEWIELSERTSDSTDANADAAEVVSVDVDIAVKDPRGADEPPHALLEEVTEEVIV